MASLPAAMAAHEFEISVTDLDASGKDYTFPVRAAWLRGVLEGTEVKSGKRDGEVTVRASKSGTDVVIHGHLHAELVAPCARCLNDANVVVDGPVSVLMVPTKKLAKAEPQKASPKADSKEPKAEKKSEGKKSKKGRSEEDDDYVFSPDEADVAPYDGDTVVLDDVVKDEILLEMPMIPLCSEDCPGISPPATEASAFAAKPDSDADHIDPRLLPLLELKKRS